MKNLTLRCIDVQSNPSYKKKVGVSVFWLVYYVHVATSHKQKLPKLQLRPLVDTFRNGNWKRPEEIEKIDDSLLKQQYGTVTCRRIYSLVSYQSVQCWTTAEKLYKVKMRFDIYYSIYCAYIIYQQTIWWLVHTINKFFSSFVAIQTCSFLQILGKDFYEAAIAFVPL